MTFLPAAITGRWFYLYLILDVYSRKVVGFEVHDRDDADHAAHLVKRTALAEGLHAMAEKPVLGFSDFRWILVHLPPFSLCATSTWKTLYDIYRDDCRQGRKSLTSLDF